MYGIIYALINLETYEAYIGRTFNYEQRKQSHLDRLAKGIHYTNTLQEAYNKFGAENFVFCFLDFCTYSNMKKKELWYIVNWPSNVYNISHKYLRKYRPFK